MKLRAEILQSGQTGDGLVTDIVVFERAYAHAVKALAAGELYCVDKGPAYVETVAAEVYTDEDNLALLDLERPREVGITQ